MYRYFLLSETRSYCSENRHSASYQIRSNWKKSFNNETGRNFELENENLLTWLRQAEERKWEKEKEYETFDTNVPLVNKVCCCFLWRLCRFSWCVYMVNGKSHVCRLLSFYSTEKTFILNDVLALGGNFFFQKNSSNFDNREKMTRRHKHEQILLIW